MRNGETDSQTKQRRLVHLIQLGCMGWDDVKWLDLKKEIVVERNRVKKEEVGKQGK